jgi:lipid A ethanolaminephosphotransferase
LAEYIFILNSYKKLTNPRLEKQKMMNFSNVSSCGTSTAYSVPCMFSLLGKDDYSPQKADNQSNVGKDFKSLRVTLIVFWTMRSKRM